MEPQGRERPAYLSTRYTRPRTIQNLPKFCMVLGLSVRARNRGVGNLRLQAAKGHRRVVFLIHALLQSEDTWSTATAEQRVWMGLSQGFEK